MKPIHQPFRKTPVTFSAFLVLAVLLTVPAITRGAEQKPTDKVTLKVIKVDSEETSVEDGKGANAVDGDPNTIWHTQWQDSSPEHPHEIIIELSRSCKIAGFTYLPRQDDNDHGQIKDYEFYVSKDGKDWGEPVRQGSFAPGKDKKTAKFAPRECRFIKLKALSELSDEAWTSAAEIGIVEPEAEGLVQPKLKLVKVDSEETGGEDGKGANALDGDPNTFWHTQWHDANPECPHEITIALDPPCEIQALTYLPRQDGNDHGTIKEYEIYLSKDGKDFGQPVKKGEFQNDSAKQTASFPPKACGFVKLKALSEANGAAWTSVAEIGVVVAQ
jgi:endo-alpha-N-acetylgalactosaminidase